MANVFGILTAIVLALAAFIATKNKAAYDSEITETANQKALLQKSQARLTTAEGILAALPIERKAVDDEVLKLTETETTEQANNSKLKTDFDAKTAKVAANKEQLDGIREKTAKTGNINELSGKLKTLNAEIEELSQSVSSTEAKLANLTAQNVQTDAEIKASTERFAFYSKAESLPSLKTRIRSLYPNWGFVTLASGNSSGVVTNSTLDVVRDGQTIAKLMVTAVESSTASASIVPDSIVPDVTLMVGDKVVPGQKATKPAAGN